MKKEDILVFGIDLKGWMKDLGKSRDSDTRALAGNSNSRDSDTRAKAGNSKDTDAKAKAGTSKKNKNVRANAHNKKDKAGDEELSATSKTHTNFITWYQDYPKFFQG